MRVSGISERTIALGNDEKSVVIIDQRRLPHEFAKVELRTVDDAARAISEMWVRGAPLIGITAAYGMYLAMLADTADESLIMAKERLQKTRPTAVNLAWALKEMHSLLLSVQADKRIETAKAKAAALAEEDVAACSRIGDHGLKILDAMHQEKGRRINVLTHCNAGWLATVDWGTALAPIYKAHDAGIPIHVFVDETRPRNQGAALSAWELQEHGVSHEIIVDNAGGHLMQHGMVDLCIVGSDRTTATGDVCNKIGTYLKALAAKDCGIPFYIALPVSTIDWELRDGVREIPIEERDEREVTHIRGVQSDGRWTEVALAPKGSRARNFGFDVTPARLVSALITEKGVVSASETAIASLLD